MSEFTDDLFVRCWIIFKTGHPRLAKSMDEIEAQVLGVVPMAKPEKENKKDAAQSDVTVV